MTWKDIKGFEGLYQISDDGRIKSLSRTVPGGYGCTRFMAEKILSCYKNRGYMYANLRKDGKDNVCQVHRLVAETFIPNPLKKNQINHIDGNKLNNTVSNLEWCTSSENLFHAFSTGLNVAHNRKLTIEDVQCIRRQKENGIKVGKVYAQFKEIVSRPTFDDCWYGKTWKNI